MVFQTRLFSPQSFLALAERVGRLSQFPAALDLRLDQPVILQQTNDLLPDYCIKMILPHWTIRTQRAVEPEVPI
jgi:hypothetical protein